MFDGTLPRLTIRRGRVHWLFDDGATVPAVVGADGTITADQIALPADITAASVEELETLGASVEARIDGLMEIDDPTAEDIVALQEAVNARGQLAAERQRRDDEAAERRAEFQSLLGQAGRGQTEDGTSEGDPADAETPPTAEAAAASPPAEDPAADPALVAAGTRTPPATNPRRTPPAPAPAPALSTTARLQSGRPAPARPASAPPRDPGATLTFDGHGRVGSWQEAVDRFVDRVSEGGFAGKQRLITVRSHIPDSLMLGSDPDENARKVKENWQRRTSFSHAALTASAADPGDVIRSTFDVMNPDASTPVADALPKLGAPRGKLRIRRPFTMADSLGLGLTKRTPAENEAARDSNSGNNPAAKSKVRLPSPTFFTVETNAWSQRILIDNRMEREDPEAMRDWLNNFFPALLAQYFEAYHLTKIANGSKVLTLGAPGASPDSLVGTSRRIVEQATRIVMYERNRHRVADRVRWTMLVPELLKEEIYADILLGPAGLAAYGLDSNAGPLNQSQLDAWTQRSGIELTWYRDDADNYDQVAAAQTSGSSLIARPTAFYWALFPVGTWVTFNEPDLNLGVIRDSTLNDNNDYEIFAEQFFEDALVGPLVKATGAVTSGTTNTSTNVTVPSVAAAGIHVGQSVAGTGIPGGATVASITNNTTIVISAAATATNASVSLTFSGGDENKGLSSFWIASTLSPTGSHRQVLATDEV